MRFGLGILLILLTPWHLCWPERSTNSYIKTRIYTSRIVYTHQDSYIYIKNIYIKKRIYTARFRIYSLRFVQFRHLRKAWPLDRLSCFQTAIKKTGSKWGSHLLLASPCLQSHDRRNYSASNVEEELSRVFLPVLVHSSLLCGIHEWIMQAMVVVERKGD